MAEIHEVHIKVISQEGFCAQGHKVGDEWTIKGKTPEGICVAAYNALYPEAMLLMCGGLLPWERIPGGTTIACPDPDNPVVFEVRRLQK